MTKRKAAAAWWLQPAISLLSSGQLAAGGSSTLMARAEFLMSAGVLALAFILASMIRADGHAK